MSSAGPDDPCAVCVFSLELPLSLAPMLNTYANMRTRSRQGLRRKLDDMIVKAQASRRFPAAMMGVRRKTTAKAIVVKGKRKIRRSTVVSGGRRRLIVVTRHSSQEPDEVELLTVDTAGGKMITDCLVRARILRADDRAWLERRASWQHAKRGSGMVTVEVYDLAKTEDE